MTDDPWAVLELPPDADEATLRRRYLELVREFPPDRAPERFAAIRAAYDEARDPHRRLEKTLFLLESGESFQRIEQDIRERIRQIPLSVDALLSLAKEP